MLAQSERVKIILNKNNCSYASEGVQEVNYCQSLLCCVIV